MPSERVERRVSGAVPLAEKGQFHDRAADPPVDILSARMMPRVSGASALDEPRSARAAILARWCGLAGRLYQFRRRRDRLFGGLFGEPAWDILLDLFVTEARGKRVAVSSACIASGVSHSTAVRQIEELVRRKLVTRERDERDKRRTYLRLSELAVHKIAQSLEHLEERADFGLQSELRVSLRR